MNLTWKDLFILGLGAIVILLAGFKLIDLMYLKNKDIEVAVVGFIGTIIGGTLSGAITLLGVKRTIDHNQLIESKKKLNEELMYLYPLLRELEEIKEHIFFEYNLNHSPADEIIKYVHNHFSIKSPLFEYAQRGSITAYHDLLRIKDLYDMMALEIFDSGNFQGLPDHKVLELIQDNVLDFIKLVRNEIKSKSKDIDNIN